MNFTGYVWAIIIIVIWVIFLTGSQNQVYSVLFEQWNWPWLIIGLGVIIFVNYMLQDYKKKQIEKKIELDEIERKAEKRRLEKRLLEEEEQEKFEKRKEKIHEKSHTTERV